MGRLVSDYPQYCEFVKNNQPFIDVVFFEKFIGKPEMLVEEINQTVFMGTFDISKKKIEEFESKYRGATDTLGSSRPNKTKEMLKKTIKEDMEDIEQMADCKELYKNLYKKDSI